MVTSPHHTGRAADDGCVVEIALDFICAGSYIGFTRLRRAAARCRSEGRRVRIDFQPVQLRPEMPEAAGSHFELHRRELGEERALEIAEDSTLGAADGLRFDFRAAQLTNTFKAHTLLLRAQSQGRGEEMAERLFRAYFGDGLHLSDEHTLASLATEVGVDQSEAIDSRVRDALARSRELGIDVTPVFRFPRGLVMQAIPTTEQLYDALLEQGRVTAQP